jgi:hypothetical protein
MGLDCTTARMVSIRDCKYDLMALLDISKAMNAIPAICVASQTQHLDWEVGKVPTYATTTEHI